MKKKTRHTVAAISIETRRAMEIVRLAQCRISPSGAPWFMKKLARIAGRIRSTTTRAYPDTVDEARSLQREIGDGLRAVIRGESWDGEPIRPILEVGGVRWEGPMRAVLVYQVMQSLAPGSGETRIAECAQDGCERIIVRQKKAEFCHPHGSPAARSARQHARRVEARRTAVVPAVMVEDTTKPPTR
jgi:hypothetical protein